MNKQSQENKKALTSQQTLSSSLGQASSPIGADIHLITDSLQSENTKNSPQVSQGEGQLGLPHLGKRKTREDIAATTFTRS